MISTHTPTSDFDHHSEQFAADPFEMLRELRDRPAAVWSNAYDGFWLVTDHENVMSGLADYATFSSGSGPAIPANPFGTRHIPSGIDPPMHGTYRKVLNSWFSKASIQKRQPEIEAMVAELVDGLAARGRWDFVTDLGEVSPGLVTLSILGWDKTRRVELLRVMSRGMRYMASTDPEQIRENEQGNLWIRDEILAEAAKRRENPTDDLMTIIANEPIVDGRAMNDDEVADTVVLLLLAGFQTTSGAFTSLMVHLERNPELRQRLNDDRELIPDAIEEIVRIYSPAAFHARIVTTDVEFAGVAMRQGDWTLFSNMAANHDPSVFENPEMVALDRNRAKSVAFGWGVHRCLGLHLARLILRIEVEAVFDRLRGCHIDLDGLELENHMGSGYFYLSVPASMPRAS